MPDKMVVDHIDKTSSEQVGLSKQEQDKITQLMNMNQMVLGLSGQLKEITFNLKNARKQIKDIRKGKGFPLIFPIGKNVFKTVPRSEKEDILKMLTENRNLIDNQMKGVQGQFEHKTDEFNGALLQVYKILRKRLSQSGFDKDDLDA